MNQQENNPEGSNLKQSIREEWRNLPSWAKLLISIAGIFGTIKWFPIIDLLELCLYVVIIPLGFLTLLGIVGAETTNAFIDTWKKVCQKIKTEGVQAFQEVQQAPQEESNAS